MVREGYYWSPERRRRLKIARRDSRDGVTVPQAERAEGRAGSDNATGGAEGETSKTVLNPEASSEFKGENLRWYKRLGNWVGGQVERVVGGVKEKVRGWREAAQKKESGNTVWDGVKNVTGAVARGVARVPLLAMKGIEKIIDKGVAMMALVALFSDIFLGTSLWEAAAGAAWNATLEALNNLVGLGIHPIAAPGVLAAPVLLFARVFLPVWSGVRNGLQEFVERK